MYQRPWYKRILPERMPTTKEALLICAMFLSGGYAARSCDVFFKNDLSPELVKSYEERRVEDLNYNGKDEIYSNINGSRCFYNFDGEDLEEKLKR